MKGRGLRGGGRGQRIRTKPQEISSHGPWAPFSRNPTNAPSTAPHQRPAPPARPSRPQGTPRPPPPNVDDTITTLPLLPPARAGPGRVRGGRGSARVPGVAAMGPWRGGPEPNTIRNVPHCSSDINLRGTAIHKVTKLPSQNARPDKFHKGDRK